MDAVWWPRGHRHQHLHLLSAAVTVALLSGCSGSSGPTSTDTLDPSGSPTSSTATASSAPGAGHNRTVGERDNGHTITVTRGDTVTVVLHNTYWSMDGSSNSQVMRASSPETHAPSGGCVPGAGCGSVKQTFGAIAQGSAHLRASRTVCGEAMACGPTQRNYDVVIVVTE